MICDYDFGVQPHSCCLESGHEGPHECTCQGGNEDPWRTWLNQKVVGWDDPEKFTEEQRDAIMGAWFMEYKKIREKANEND